MCTPCKVNTADSSASESSWSSGSNFSDFETSMEGESMKGLWSLLVKSDPGDFNRQEEMKVERASQKRIKSPYSVAVSRKKATNGECITLVNIVSENPSRLDYRIPVHSLPYE